MSNLNSLWNLQRRVWQRTRPLLQRIGLELNFRFFLRWLEFNPIFAFPRELLHIFLQNNSDMRKKLWNHPCQLENILNGWSYKAYVVPSYLQSKSLLGKVFTTHIMNTQRIFQYSEYCFVNNAVEIAPPIINIIPTHRI